MKQLTILFCVLLVVVSCRKKPDPASTSSQPIPMDSVIIDTVGTVSFKVTNIVGNELLVLKDKWYLNENGDSFKVFVYKYYLSNIAFVREDGTIYSVPESYYLLDQSNPSSLTFTVENVPVGTYHKIQLIIGVDERRNQAGAQTGALDPIHGMFWDWNTGYIMAKIEGESPQALNPAQIITYHVGGTKPPYNSVRRVALDLPTKLEISSLISPQVLITSDVAEWFKTPNLIKFGESSGAMTPGEEIMMIADNYRDMLTVKAIMP